MKIAILGSGSSSVASALVIEEFIIQNKLSNIEIDIIDYGLTRKINLDKLRYRMNKNSTKVTHAFDIPTQFKISSKLENGLAGSAAYGGWSNVWGATAIPYSEWGLSHWGTLRYEMKLEFKNLSNKIQNLNTLNFNLELRKKSSLIKNSPKNGLGLMNLAINPISMDINKGCNQCGDCLNSCPKDHIWSAKVEWERILKLKQFTYLSDCFIYKIKEVNEQVEVICLINNEKKIFVYDRVFVGLGSIQTSALMLRSNLVKAPLVLKESSMTIVPFISKSLKKIGKYENRIALSEGYILNNTKALQNNVDFFCQIYCYSKSLDEQLVINSKLWKILPRYIRKFVGQYVGVALVFFDESLSHQIILEKKDNDIIEIIPQSNFNNKKIKKIQRMQIISNFNKFGLCPVTFMTKKTNPGQSYHLGASFKLNKNTKKRNSQTNIFGCISDMHRLHLIDSSSLPIVTAAPITWTTMANAMRITRAVLSEIYVK